MRNKVAILQFTGNDVIERATACIETYISSGRELIGFSHQYVAGSGLGNATQHVFLVFQTEDKIKTSAEELYFLLDRIVTDLPVNKNWLDPAIERQSKELVAKLKEK